MPTRKSLTRWQKATALLPLALLSGAWTYTTALPTSATASPDGGSGRLPDGTTVPQQAIKAPASVSTPGEVAPGIPQGSESKVIAGASTNGIPAAALSAYQRAAQVIDTADKTCHLSWTVVAAIGRVESNHGRFGGNTLSANGVSRPGIYGIPLDGRNGTQKIADTDGGKYDHDPQYDRAVGPMQFIPSTWSVVGVDGDGDGKRNPQDIDDAALATAVYLCSGKENLSSDAGERSAIYRYNHSTDYVNLVMSIARAYAKGDYSAVPTSSGGGATFTPDYGDSVFASGTSGYHVPGGGGLAHAYRDSGSSGGAGSGGSSTSSGAGAGSSSGTLPSAGPTAGSGGGSSLPGTGGSSGGGGGSNPISKPVASASAAVSSVTKPVKVLITAAQATTMCKNAGAPSSLLSKCVADLMGKTVPEAQSAVGGIVAALIKELKCSLPVKPPGC